MILSVLAKPKSKRPGIDKISETEWIVRLNSPPIDGEANEELVKRIARELGIAKSKIILLTGHTAKNKKFQVDLD